MCQWWRRWRRRALTKRHLLLMDRHRCTKRHVEVVTTLVELGADIGALNGRGETPLQVSIRGGHHQVARVLRELERSARTKKEAAAKESTKQAIDQAERNAAELIEEEEREEAA
jgi:ankyrin repeat protein